MFHDLLDADLILSRDGYIVGCVNPHSTVPAAPFPGLSSQEFTAHVFIKH